jgi:hypothetical protein
MSEKRRSGVTMSWTQHARKALGCSGLLLVSAASSSAAQPANGPWTLDRVQAVVRIEVPQQRGGTSIGTGFVVKGNGDRTFVLTSTHVVLPERDTAQTLPSGCGPLLNGTRVLQGNSGGPELRPHCVYHLESDTSLVELEPRDAGYLMLVPSARNLAVGETVWLAGFPLGIPREIRGGKVTQTTGPDSTVITEILTAEGMSGGPYLGADGMVVGIHRGGGRYTAGFPHLTPIWRLRTSLEGFLPRISDEPPSTPSRPDAELAAARECNNVKLQELRSEREPFTYRERISCGSDQPRNTKFVTYDVREKRPGYAVTGFVLHRDNVRNGRVGMLRYTALGRSGTLAVEVRLECDVSNLARTEEGFAETELSGYLRRIETKEALAAIKRACHAGGR